MCESRVVPLRAAAACDFARRLREHRPPVDAAKCKAASGRYTHSVGRIIRVYLWSVLHDRPIDWACRRGNRQGVRPPDALPHQSQMSRRLRQKDTLEFLTELTRRFNDRHEYDLVKMLDGKPLPVARHSQDADATFGYGA